MPKKIVLPAALERRSPIRGAPFIDAVRGVFTPWRHRPGVLQSDASAFNPSSQMLRDGSPSHPPSSNEQSSDALSAIHPPSDDIAPTPIHTMQRLLPVRPPSPPNQTHEDSDESDFEDEDDEDLLQTQPPEINPPTFQSPPPSIFADMNKEYVPPSDHEYPPVPVKIYDTIEWMLREVWGITEPRPYQVKSIFYLAFLKMSMLYLIRKTGEGKSLVLLGTATILRGVTVCLVPLLGLGSSHASKTKCKKHRIEGYHVDEYRDEDFDALKNRMSTYSAGEESSVILYISPQNLQLPTKWYRLLSDIASSGFISSVCVDEAHACVEQGESFRPEFKSSISALNSLIAIAKLHFPARDIPILVMSATFRIPEQKSFNSMIGRFPEVVFWGDMNRRNVGLFATVAGEPLTHLVKAWRSDIINDPESQSLIMANSAAACDGRILDRLEKVVASLPDAIKGEITKYCIPFTGDSGLMLKMFLMECFCGEYDDDSLINIWCMACTAAAHCGVSSKRCTQCYRYGPVPNWYDLVQEAGRVDRLLNAPSGARCHCEGP
eukprot:scaffold35768_cov46-Cyclotella_meneghiniana.AAC.2